MRYKVTELSKLIRICGKAGVAELKIADFHVTFSKSKAPDEVASGLEQPSFITDEKETDILLKDEIRLRADQLDLALIERPHEYEQMLFSGDLEDEKADH